MEVAGRPIDYHSDHEVGAADFCFLNSNIAKTQLACVLASLSAGGTPKSSSKQIQTQITS